MAFDLDAKDQKTGTVAGWDVTVVFLRTPGCLHDTVNKTIVADPDRDPAIRELLILNLNRWILGRFAYNTPFRWVLAYDPAHLWFVQALLIFAVLYALVRLIFRGSATRPLGRFHDRFPPSCSIALWIATLAVLTFAVRIAFPVGQQVFHLQLGHFVHYVFSFAVGVSAYRGKWLDHLSKAHGRRWGWAAAALIPALPLLLLAGGVLDNEANLALYMGGAHWQSFSYALWESVMLFAMTIFLLTFFRERFNNATTLVRNMAGSVFTVYIIHMTVLYVFQVGLRSVGIPSIVKFFAVGLLATASCFLLAAAMRKIPLVRPILG